MTKVIQVTNKQREGMLRNWLHKDGGRLGLITSIDGDQLVTLVLATKSGGENEIWQTPITEDHYPSITPTIPQCHWYERMVWDMFGLMPDGHPRLKHNLLHEPYDPSFFPLRQKNGPLFDMQHRHYHHLEVKGKGVYELPVGPIHAGIIEPGHFRFSCLGEVVVNLEIRLGYVHRGVEKRITEVPWSKARFVAEAAASDMIVANALAHATAIESCFELTPPERALALRTVALEIERAAMHIADIGGIAGDIGFLAVSSSMARLRGTALGMGELLTGSRFQKSFVKPGGVSRNPTEAVVSELKATATRLREELKPVLDMLMNNQVARERMQGVGVLSQKLANDFGVVGVAARASGIHYDSRLHFSHGLYPSLSPKLAVAQNGDVYSRTKVRTQELLDSLVTIEQILSTLTVGDHGLAIPKELPMDSVGLGIVESHRGELIHLFFTDKNGRLKRYAIKDPSVNNWTALAIAVRNNLVSDFPLCNKSFSLSYSGHDL